MAPDSEILCLEGGGGLPFTVSEVPRHSLIIKEGDCFFYSYDNGDMGHGNRAGLGLYYRDTRYLSTMETHVEGTEPLFLSSSNERGYMANIHLSNPDINTDEGMIIPKDAINIRRSRLIQDGLLERISMRNYHTAPIHVALSLNLASDFADIFEVRGMCRERRGTVHRPTAEGKRINLSYTGTDRMKYTTMITFSREPDELRLGRAGVSVSFFFLLNPYEVEFIDLWITPLQDSEEKRLVSFDETRADLRRSYEEWIEEATAIDTSNNIFNLMLNRSLRDLRSLYTRTRFGEIMVGGVPWYSAPFGRDALISCYEVLMFKPELARSSLLFLAAFQGKELNDWRDEAPGKIMHEIRQGEMARVGEIPHVPYYGTIDATPLFLILVSEYLRWTGDWDLFYEIGAHIDAALQWIDAYGDQDGDGLVEYSTQSSVGLSNQFWKDSGDSILLPGGRMPTPPVATVETQGYVYYAKRRLGRLFLFMGQEERGHRLLEEAEEIRRKVEELFWDEELGFYVLALDGAKRPIRVVSSNAGQLLFTGLPSIERAARVIEKLAGADMFSGWGIRTLSENEYYYNPMSYHNGSIWPHDNAMILRGIKRYGDHSSFFKIMDGLSIATTRMDYLRLPELFCGFARAHFDDPVPYPVACSPQAWASGSVFMILQTMLGLYPNAPRGVFYINNPSLPPWLDRVRIDGLRVGDTRLSLLFRREAESTVFSVLEKRGSIRVVVEE